MTKKKDFSAKLQNHSGKAVNLNRSIVFNSRSGLAVNLKRGIVSISRSGTAIPLRELETIPHFKFTAVSVRDESH